MLCIYSYCIKITFCLVSCALVETWSPVTSSKGFEFPNITTVNNKEPRRNFTVEFEETEESALARLNEQITLHCMVKNLGDNVVSWIRKKDLKILTSDVVTFAADKRFHVEHSDDEPNAWNLIVNSVQAYDAGEYECQINTEPKLKRSVILSIYSGNGIIDYPEESAEEQNEKEKHSKVDSIQKIDNQEYSSTANILGKSELFVHPGSTITLVCYIKSTNTSSFDQYFSHRRPVKWLHFSDLLTAESERGGISIETEKYSNLIKSRLTMVKVTNKDAGPYTCKPIKGRAALVYLNIVQNELMEAMKPENYWQTNNALKKCDSILNILFTFKIFYFLVSAW